MTASPEALAAALIANRAFIHEAMDAVLPKPEGPEARVSEAMRYAALGGGKRLRAFIAMETGKLFGVERSSMARVAAAIECLHAYSLVHDDLPAMDNDGLRHGKPSTHRAFDEATAILAGDGLLTLAFGVLASAHTHADPHIRVELIARLAQAAGAHGMVGGQMIDMQAAEHELSLPEITRLQRLKTGALFEFSAEAGAIMGKAGREARHALHGYTQELGLAFQIADDLLDVEGDAAAMGKAARKDANAGKATFVTLMGIDRAREQAHRLAAQAVQHLEIFDEKADFLRALAQYVVVRSD
jgi:farnesyl diphosphate synthase